MKFLLYVISLFVLASTALADETMRKPGDASLNFSLVKTQLQQYKYGFGGKFWTSSDIAYAASFDIGTYDSESNYSDSSAYTNASKSDDKYYAFSFAIEKHLLNSSNLSPYVGGEVQYSRYSYDDSYDYSSSTSYRYEYLSRQYGAAVLAGAEYAINKNISLAGEYGYGFFYRTSKYESSWSTETTRSRRFDLSVGRLTLLLYF